MDFKNLKKKLIKWKIQNSMSFMMKTRTSLPRTIPFYFMCDLNRIHLTMAYLKKGTRKKKKFNLKYFGHICNLPLFFTYGSEHKTSCVFAFLHLSSFLAQENLFKKREANEKEVVNMDKVEQFCCNWFRTKNFYEPWATHIIDNRQ